MINKLILSIIFFSISTNLYADYVDIKRHVPPTASQSEAETGTVNTKMMTPLRTQQAITVLGGNVTGQASSVDNEITLFSGTTGKVIKRAAITGLVKSTSGVIGTATAGTDYVAPNAGIVGATNTKITYDAKGLVTVGASATTVDIADSANKRYVTDAQLTVLGNTSGTNTGDNSANSSTTYIGTTAIPLNRASAAQSLTGITSIDGNASTVTTNANLTGHVTSIGNATSLGSFSSANLSGALSDKTGTGVSVFGTSPSFTTQITTPSIISSGALGITPASGSNVNVNLSGEGDFAVNNNQLYVDTSVGNVGIGTTSPKAKLDVQTAGAVGSNVTGLIVAAQDTYAGAPTLDSTVGLDFVLRQADSAGYSYASIRAGEDVGQGALQGALRFFTQAYSGGSVLNERMRITSSGNVGIGITTPSAQLHTTGTVRFQNFGAGTATFDANGNVSSVSDERFKNIDGEFTVGLNQILGINPIKYHWNDLSGLEKDNLYTGFSAQNIRKYIPEAVSINGQGYYTVQDKVITAVLVNATKELSKEIDTLRKELSMVSQIKTPQDLSKNNLNLVKTTNIHLQQTELEFGIETHEYVDTGVDSETDSYLVEVEKDKALSIIYAPSKKKAIVYALKESGMLEQVVKEVEDTEAPPIAKFVLKENVIFDEITGKFFERIVNTTWIRRLKNGIQYNNITGKFLRMETEAEAKARYNLISQN